MNKKFLAILALLSFIPGCIWGPRYQCNPPCGQQMTTCEEATDCYQEEEPVGETTCYEEECSATDEVGEEYCYEDTEDTRGIECEPSNAEYCYEATDYPEFEEFPTEETGYGDEVEEFNYDEFDEFDE